MFCSLYSDRAGHFFVTPKRGERSGYEPADAGGTGASRTWDTNDPGVFAASSGTNGAKLSARGKAACRRNCDCAASPIVNKANEFLRTEYIAEFNSKFTVPAAQKGTAFVRLHRRDLDWIFSVQHERTVNHDNTVLLGSRVLQLEKTRWRNTLAGQTVIVHEHLDGRVSIRYGPHVIAEYTGNCLAAAIASSETHGQAGEPSRGLAKSEEVFCLAGGSASRPPGFNALGQNCWMRSEPNRLLPHSRP